MKIQEMKSEHIINRIKWLEKQKVDEYDIHGYDEKYMAISVFTTSCALEFNKKIDRQITLLKKEANKRKNI